VEMKTNTSFIVVLTFATGEDFALNSKKGGGRSFHVLTFYHSSTKEGTHAAIVIFSKNGK